MSVDLNSVALWLGGAAVVSTVGTGVASLLRAYMLRRTSYKLELTFADQSFVFDASAIDREDSVKIERAREAVQEVTRVAA